MEGSGAGPFGGGGMTEEERKADDERLDKLKPKKDKALRCFKVVNVFR